MSEHSLMTQHPRVLDNNSIEAISAQRAEAQTEIHRICSGERRWTMCVPIQKTDSDIILSQALDNSKRLEQEVYRLRGAVKRIAAETEMPGDVHDALMAILFGAGDDSGVSSCPRVLVSS